MLIILSGLPGTGKTTIAGEVARVMMGVRLRLDAIEAPMFAAGWQVEGVGYEVAHAIAEDNLRLGASHSAATGPSGWPGHPGEGADPPRQS